MSSANTSTLQHEPAVQCGTNECTKSPAMPKRKKSFQNQMTEALDEDKIKEDLLAWDCAGRKCGRCLSALTDTELMLSFAVTCISAARQRTFERKNHDMSKYIEEMLWNCLRLGTSTVQYVVAGVRSCKAGWNWAHGFTTVTSNRVHAKFNAFWKSANPVMSSTVHNNDSSISTGATATAERWLLEWLILATHNPPNASKGSVPPMGASILYPQYEKWCSTAKVYPIQLDGFRGKLSTIKRALDVATRKSKQGSAECPICSVLKRAEAKTFSLHFKAEIKKLQAQHIEFTNAEGKVYLNHAFEAQDNPSVSVNRTEWIFIYLHAHHSLQACSSTATAQREDLDFLCCYLTEKLHFLCI